MWVASFFWMCKNVKILWIKAHKTWCFVEERRTKREQKENNSHWGLIRPIAERAFPEIELFFLCNWIRTCLKNALEILYPNGWIMGLSGNRQPLTYSDLSRIMSASASSPVAIFLVSVSVIFSFAFEFLPFGGFCNRLAVNNQCHYSRQCLRNPEGMPDTPSPQPST